MRKTEISAQVTADFIIEDRWYEVNLWFFWPKHRNTWENKQDRKRRLKKQWLHELHMYAEHKSTCGCKLEATQHQVPFVRGRRELFAAAPGASDLPNNLCRKQKTGHSHGDCRVTTMPVILSKNAAIQERIVYMAAIIPCCSFYLLLIHFAVFPRSFTLKHIWNTLQWSSRSCIVTPSLWKIIKILRSLRGCAGPGSRRKLGSCTRSKVDILKMTRYPGTWKVGLNWMNKKNWYKEQINECETVKHMW